MKPKNAWSEDHGLSDVVCGVYALAPYNDMKMYKVEAFCDGACFSKTVYISYKDMVNSKDNVVQYMLHKAYKEIYHTIWYHGGKCKEPSDWTFNPDLAGASPAAASI